MTGNPLQYVKPEHLEPLKQLIPHLAIDLEVYIFGDASVRPDYSGRVQLEVIARGDKFLHEMSEDEVQESINRAKQNHTHSENPEDWDPREDIPVIPLINRVSETYGNRPFSDIVPDSPDQDGVLEAIVVADGKLIDLTKAQKAYGILSYGRFVLRYQGVEFEVYATRAPLPGSENLERITTGDEIILHDLRYGTGETRHTR